MSEHTHNDGTVHDHYIFSERDHATDYGGLASLVEPTPGPWRLWDDGKGRWYLWTEDDDPATSEDGRGFVLGPFEGFRLADARLIAAAPELLAALEGLMNEPGIETRLAHRDEDVERARAAIAKARGKQEAAPKGRSAQ